LLAEEVAHIGILWSCVRLIPYTYIIDYSGEEVKSILDYFFVTA